NTELPDAVVTQDTMTATETAEARLVALEDRLRTGSLADDERLRANLEKTRLLTEVDRKDEAWELARATFDAYMEKQDYEGAVDACDALFLTEQDESLAALGMGVWLGVTFPIDPDLSVAMLQHIIDETPDDADGAAVAAATAHYIADMRSEGSQRDKLIFFTNQMLGNVARRHSEIETQEKFDFWINKMELDDPAKFLIRLRNVVDVLVQEDWWFDREQLQTTIPDN
ncbi:MAG: hypothetical protein OQL16_08175, partial [Gammaproteobacteria bacterium]|nr:hypothetical protein [Gammaproteobacteria bacterium]